MSIGARDIQHIIAKMYFLEKFADVTEKSHETRNIAIGQRFIEQQDYNRNTVQKTEPVVGRTIDEYETSREQYKYKPKYNDIEKKSERTPPRFLHEPGQIIDMDA